MFSKESFQKLVDKVGEIRKLAGSFQLRDIYLTSSLSAPDDVVMLLSSEQLISFITLIQFKQQMCNLLDLPEENDNLKVEALESLNPETMDEYYAERISLLSSSPEELSDFIHQQFRHQLSQQPIMR